MKKIICSCAAALLLSGCATEPGQDRNNTAIGAVSGAVAGALIGRAAAKGSDSDKETIAGALIGAAAGAGIGQVMDRQETAFRQSLANEQAQSQIEIQRVRDDLLQVTFDNEVGFALNSASILPAFRNSLDKVADTLIKYESQATIVGHTDSTGTDSYNQDLSERRAQAVRNYLMDRGVPSSRLTAYGRGESEPRATNDTEAGRQLNRRVDIFVRSGNTAVR